MSRTVTLETTYERLEQAAAICPQIRQTLETLFPEMKENKKYILDCSSDTFRINGVGSIQIRTIGNLAYKGFWLSDGYEWIITRDNDNAPCLVFREK